MTLFSIYLLLVFLCAYIFKKKGLLLNYSGESHQSFSNKKNVPLSGGIFMLIPIIFFLSSNIILIFFFISIFLIGFFSDRKILISPQKRFIFQTILILLFVTIVDLKIFSSKIELFDVLLKNEIFAYFFSSFCILILINGNNFIDGLNGLVISYSTIVLYFLWNLGLIENYVISDQSVNLILMLLIFLLLLNVSNILMIGDGGAYLLGFFLGYIIISSHINNPNISPYFYIALIWYPCFENLFSILRKLKQNFSPLSPDSKHLHQLVFFLVRKKLNLSMHFSNNLSSMLILFFNFLIIYISSLYPQNTLYQVKLITTSVILYYVIYTLLRKYNELNFKS